MELKRRSSKYNRRQAAKMNSEYIEYCNSMRTPIVTTRFNNESWNENELYRLKYPTIGCIYATPEMNSERIRSDCILFVLEMNNEEK